MRTVEEIKEAFDGTRSKNARKALSWFLEKPGRSKKEVVDKIDSLSIEISDLEDAEKDAFDQKMQRHALEWILENPEKQEAGLVQQYDQTEFLIKKKEYDDLTPATKWGYRVDDLMSAVASLKRDADPSWDVYNHLDVVSDRLTEVQIYAEMAEQQTSPRKTRT